MPLNTATTIVTFVIAFLILIATKCESRAIQAKLDGPGTDQTRNAVARVEKQGNEVLDQAPAVSEPGRNRAGSRSPLGLEAVDQRL